MNSRSPIALTRRDVPVVALYLGCHPRDYINLRAGAAGPGFFLIFGSHWRIGEKMDRMYCIIIIGICFCMWGYLISFPARVRIISKIKDRNIKIIIDGLEVCPRECHGSRMIRWRQSVEMIQQMASGVFEVRIENQGLS